MIRRGVDVQVIDNATGEDITEDTFAQVLRSGRRSDADVLSAMIRTPGRIAQAIAGEDEQAAELRELRETVRRLSETIDKLRLGRRDAETSVPAARPTRRASIGSKRGASRAREPQTGRGRNVRAGSAILAQRAGCGATATASSTTSTRTARSRSPSSPRTSASAVASARCSSGSERDCTQQVLLAVLGAVGAGGAVCRSRGRALGARIGRRGRRVAAVIADRRLWRRRAAGGSSGTGCAALGADRDSRWRTRRSESVSENPPIRGSAQRRIAAPIGAVWSELAGPEALMATMPFEGMHMAADRQSGSFTADRDRPVERLAVRHRRDDRGEGARRIVFELNLGRPVAEIAAHRQLTPAGEDETLLDYRVELRPPTRCRGCVDSSTGSTICTSAITSITSRAPRRGTGRPSRRWACEHRKPKEG